MQVPRSVAAAAHRATVAGTVAAPGPRGPSRVAVEQNGAVQERHEVPEVQVTALWLPGAERATLRAAAHERLGGRGTRLCPACASVEHGRPHVRGRHVSLAYAPGVVLIASTTVPVGIDVEEGGELAWTRVEAVLKCTGEGLRRDPRDVGDDTAEGLSTQPLPLPAGWVGTVATAVPARLSWAARGAPSRTTTA